MNQESSTEFHVAWSENIEDYREVMRKLDSQTPAAFPLITFPEMNVFPK